jgi:hypothetical protein
VKAVMATADQPGVVADVVLRAASAARPKVRYTAGGLAGRLRFLRTYMPAGMVAFLGLLAGTLQLARATPDRVESDAILAAGVRAAIRLAT